MRSTRLRYLVPAALLGLALSATAFADEDNAAGPSTENAAGPNAAGPNAAANDQGAWCPSSRTTRTLSWNCPAGTQPDPKSPQPNCLESIPIAPQAAVVAPVPAAPPPAPAPAPQSQNEMQPAPSERGPAAPHVLSQKMVEFKPGSTALGDTSKATLAQIARAVRASPRVATVEVVGHADNTGNPQQNRIISAERAQAVKDYLQQQGIPSDKIETRALSEWDPVASNDSPAGRAMNRSAVVVAIE